MWSKNPSYLFQIAQTIKQDDPDVVHLQYEVNMFGGVLTALMFPWLILTLRIQGFNTVVTIHSIVAREAVDKKFVSFFKSYFSIVTPAMMKVFYCYSNMFISTFSDRIVVHTSTIKHILCREYRVPESKVNVIPIGIPPRDASKTEKENYFFYFGYIARRKGLEHVVRGFKKFIDNNPKPEYRLLLAGGVIRGQEDAFKEIQSLILTLGLEGRVILMGFVEEEDLQELYAESLAVVIPAIVSMGSSGPLFHAISYGKCVIASDEGYLREDIRQMTDGFLVDNDKWEDAFQFVIDNPGTVSKIEENVARKATERSSQTIAQKHVAVYAEALA